jgi:hypothetical protein
MLAQGQTEVSQFFGEIKVEVIGLRHIITSGYRRYSFELLEPV